MKNLTKVFGMVLSIILTMNLSTVQISAAEPTSNESAELLSKVGMFKGSDIGFELDREPSRLEGLVMIIRLLGKEEEVLDYEIEKTTFEDVPDWGEQYVQYAFDEGLAKGISQNEFGADMSIDSKSYMTFVLRVLGYDDSKDDFEWDKAVNQSVDLGVIDGKTERKLRKFTRADMAEVSLQALKAEVKGEEKVLAEVLVGSSNLSKADASELGIAIASPKSSGSGGSSSSASAKVVEETKTVANESVKVTPVVEPVAVEKPATVKPVVEAPVVEKPVIEQPVIEQPSVKTSEKGAYLSQYANISGSIAEYSGSMNAGSNVLQLSTSNHDFKVGHGISIENAGNDSSKNNWAITTVTAVNGNQLTLAASASRSVGSASILHDDTSAVNAAISGGEGTYYFDIKEMNVKGVKLQSNTTYDGLNQCTLYLPMAYSDVPYVQQMIEIDGKSNVTFQNFTVDGNKSRGFIANEQVGVTMMKLTFTSGVDILNNTFKSSGFSAINMRSTNSDILVEGNTILNTDVGIYAMPEWNGSLSLENAIFRDNYIDGGTSEAISISSGMWENKGVVNNILIDGNVLKNKSATALQMGSRTTNITVSNNEISGSNHGITTMDKNLETVDTLTARNVTITGNTIHDNTWHNLMVDGADVTVTGNHFSNGNDVVILGLTSLKGVTLESNTFANVGNSIGAVSIYNTDNALIKSNTFQSGKVAISVKGSNLSNLQIINNDLGGMSIQGATQVVGALTGN